MVSKLQALGHDVDTVRAERLAGRDDNEVWGAAQSVERFFITQDLDFSDLRRYTPGTHAGLLLVRLAQPGRNALAARVAMLFATEPGAGQASSMKAALACDAHPSRSLNVQPIKRTVDLLPSGGV